MGQHIEEQHDVECSDSGLAHVLNVEHPISHRVASAILAHVEEAFETAEAWVDPGVQVNRQHARRTAPHCLEAEGAIPGADVQNAAPLHIDRAEDRLEFPGQDLGRLAAGDPRSVRQRKRVMPRIGTQLVDRLGRRPESRHQCLGATDQPRFVISGKGLRDARPVAQPIFLDVEQHRREFARRNRELADFRQPVRKGSVNRLATQ